MERALYVGTYTGPGKAEGLYVCRFDDATGALALAHTVRDVASPSFLAIDRRQRYLYACNELTEYEGRPGGSISAFAIDPSTGNLTFLNRQASHGTAPCYVSFDAEERHVLVANYGSGVLSVFPLESDGRLRSASDVVQHEGRGPNARRQEGPHAHSIRCTPDGRYVLACDLGIDRVLVYRFDASAGKLTPNDLPFAQVSSGAGPRHTAFHPQRPHVYVNNEIDSTLSVFEYDAERGALDVRQTLPTLPADFEGRSTTAQVIAHPNGRTVYVSNRGHDSIAIFTVDERGRLTPAGHVSTQGKTPRNFTLDLSGTWLVAANQSSGNLVSFRIDPQTGELTPSGHTLGLPAPVCLVFSGA